MRIRRRGFVLLLTVVLLLVVSSWLLSDVLAVVPGCELRWGPPAYFGRIAPPLSLPGAHIVAHRLPVTRRAVLISILCKWADERFSGWLLVDGGSSDIHNHPDFAAETTSSDCALSWGPPAYLDSTPLGLDLSHCEPPVSE